MFFGRGKNKKQNPYTLSHMYKDYCNNVKDNPIYQVDYKTYRLICEEYYAEVTNRILQGNFIKLQAFLGTLSIIKHKRKLSAKRLYPDWAKTVQYDKIVYHTNEHTRGFSYKVFWNKKASNIHNIQYYSFTLCRKAKRLLAQYIKQSKYDYFEKK